MIPPCDHTSEISIRNSLNGYFSSSQVHDWNTLTGSGQTPPSASLIWAGRSCCSKAGQEKVSKTPPPTLQPRQQTAETVARS